MKKKIIRVTTVPQSLGGLLRGQLKFMSDYYEMIGISSNGNGFLNRYKKKEGVKVYQVEMTRKITPLQDLKAVWRLYKIFKKEKPFIVHTHTPKAGTLGMTAAYLANVPHRLHTIAGMPLLERTGNTRKLLDLVEKLTFAFSTMVYPNSFEMKKIVLKNGYTTEKKLKVLGNGSSNGVDGSYFDPNRYSNYRKARMRSYLGLKQNDFVYLYVGRLVKDKGIEELIEAFDLISKENQDVKLLLVGYFEKKLDPLSTKTEESIKSNPNIIYVGGRLDVRSYYAVSNVLTFPSYREGFPNVVMESGSMGLPAIVSDINGCNEIIVNGKNGLIIPPKDCKALKNQMLNCYKNRGMLQILAENSRHMVIDRYERQFVWKKILEEYKLLESQSSKS